jgi:hypothetical protein
MRRIGGYFDATQVSENPLDDLRILDAGDHAQPPAAATTGLNGSP